jgi:hypothetical protein
VRGTDHSLKRKPKTEECVAGNLMERRMAHRKQRIKLLPKEGKQGERKEEAG